MKYKKRNALMLGFVFCVLLVLLTGGAYYHYFASPVFGIEKTTYLYIDTDDDMDSVRHKLANVAHPRTLTGFDILCSFHDNPTRIKTGRYALEPNETMRHTFRKLQAGWQTPVRLVVPEVRTLDKLAESIGQQLMITPQELTTLLTDTAFINRLGYTSVTLPTLFIPNTYEVYWNVSAEKLIERMQTEHQRFWNEKRKAQAAALGLTPDEVGTLASIVDEETAYNPEKPTIAGLYLNRLRRGMLLQADPTVKFALQDFTLKRIYEKHLKTDSPYNTYLYPGLPPGPIRIPSVAGIESVLNAAQHDYLYMCAKEDFSGRHNFARSLSAHLTNARRYQQALNRRNIK